MSIWLIVIVICGIASHVTLAEDPFIAAILDEHRLVMLMVERGMSRDVTQTAKF